MENQEKFSYTYSAKEQAEINRIREKYAAPGDKMEQLRKLDAGVTEKRPPYRSSWAWPVR